MHYPLRKSGAELPSATELIVILRQESPRRAVRFDYLLNHREIFDYRHELSRRAKSDDSWTYAYPTCSLEQLVDAVQSNHDALAEYIRRNPQDSDIYERLFDALTLGDDTAQSEAIFVFGAVSNARIERAVELYHEGIAPKIIVSGRRPFYGDSSESEAVRMAAYAVEHGVPATDIVIEEGSITLPDNVKRTLDIMERTNWRPKVITIVSARFVVRRAVMEWYKFTPWDIKVRAVAPRTPNQRFTREGWHGSQESIALILNEYAKLVLESKIDLMRRDGELSD